MIEIGAIVRIVSQLAARQVAARGSDPIEDPETPLAVLGLESLQIVELMVDVESAFSVEFPPEMVNDNTFRSVRTIAEAVRAVQAGRRSGL